MNILLASESVACDIDASLWSPLHSQNLRSDLNQSYAGQALRFRATFTDGATGALVDPSNIEYAYQVGGSTIERYQYPFSGSMINRVSEGYYEIQFNTSSTQYGVWNYIWAANGSHRALISKAINVLNPTIGSNLP